MASFGPCQRIGHSKSSKVKSCLLAEADDEDAFAVLRHPRLRIDDPPRDVVAELSLSERRRMTSKVSAAWSWLTRFFTFSKQESLRPVMAMMRAMSKEQRSLRLAGEAVRDG